MLASSSIRLGVHVVRRRTRVLDRDASERRTDGSRSCDADAFSSPVGGRSRPGRTSERVCMSTAAAPSPSTEARCYFSEFTDQRLYRHVPGSGEPVPITPETGGTHRFADGRVTPDGSTWIGVRERHAGGTRSRRTSRTNWSPSRTDGSGEPRVIASGAGLLLRSRIAPDGASICWLSWDLPWMPWDGCELHEAALAPDGSLGEPRTVAGRDGEESIWQPSWSPAGELVLGERCRRLVEPGAGARGHTGDRVPARCRVRVAALGLRRVVVRVPRRRKDRLPLRQRRCAAHRAARSRRRASSSIWTSRTAVSYPSLGAEGSQIAFIAGGPLSGTGGAARLHEPGRRRAPGERQRGGGSGGVLDPRQLEFPTDGGLHRLRPRLPAHESGFRAPDGERPPLDRDQPRRSDVGIDALVLAPDAVLDQPRSSRWST